MKYHTVFNLLSDIFNKSGIKSILIGGFAVNYYKVTRQTIDVDFLITKDDFNKIKNLLENEGYKEDEKKEIFVRLKGDLPYMIDIDFMFVDESTFDKIVDNGKEIKIAGENFIVPSIEHLIALKLHAIKNNPERKYKDLIDIIGLIKKNRINIKEAEFRDICCKYGTEELYKEILNLV